MSHDIQETLMGTADVRRLEEDIRTCNDRISALDACLMSQKVSVAKQAEIASELKEIRKLLATYQRELKFLQTRRQWLKVLSILIFICCAVYMLYILLWGRDY